jgi:hypothetical protein
VAVPSLEDVVARVIERLQDLFGAAADTAGGSGTTDIEIVDDEGAPVIEMQDKPKITIYLPRLRDNPTAPKRIPGERVITSIDRETLTYTDAPQPAYKDLDFQVICAAMQAHSWDTGQKGLLWFEDKLTFLGDGEYLTKEGWTADEPGFRGYFFRMTQAPQPIGGGLADLKAFSCTLTLERVRFTDGSDGSGPLTGTINLDVQVLPEVDEPEEG